MSQAEIQIIIGFVAPYLLEWLKKASFFPWLTERSDKAVKVVWSALVAAGSALAVSFSFDPTLGQLTVSGLSWANVGNGLMAFLLSLMAQQVSYRITLSPPARD
jgi:hypothetical protein